MSNPFASLNDESAEAVWSAFTAMLEETRSLLILVGESDYAVIDKDDASNFTQDDYLYQSANIIDVVNWALKEEPHNLRASYEKTRKVIIPPDSYLFTSVRLESNGNS